MFDNFKYLKDTSLLLFSQLCICCYADIVAAVVDVVQLEDRQIYTEAITKNKDGKIILKKNNTKI